MASPPFTGDGLDPSLLPLEELADCAAAVLAGDGKRILSYGTGAGYTPLRELIGEWFGVHPGRVLLTNGWLQGLALVAGGLPHGRAAIAEYPINDRAQAALLDAGAVLASVTIDENGLSTAELRQHLTEYLRPALVYTIPTFHNPTGWTMTEERRCTLVELIAVQNRLQIEDILVLEDDAYGLTRFEGERLPALFDLSGKTTAYSSSFSATIAPGLRVGWLILPEERAAGLVAAANSTYISPALLGQAVAFEFIRRGSFEPHLTRLRAGLKQRRDTMLAALERHFPDASWSRPEGGLFVWLELPAGTDSRRFAAATPAARPGTEFASTANLIRLSYGALPPEQIAPAIERLAAARAG